MHRGDSGREPLRGLTAERFTPPYEFAAGQKDWLQSWAVGFFNAPGRSRRLASRLCSSIIDVTLTRSRILAASVLGQVWANPSLPEATKSLQFPKQSVIVKTLFSDATDEQVPSQKGSPAWDAVSHLPIGLILERNLIPFSAYISLLRLQARSQKQGSQPCSPHTDGYRRH